ncbi:MAG TPA: helix-turn-helix domain-containing protein [Stenotrophomonas sp.]|jgi:AraC-like DNA-binding protein
MDAATFATDDLLAQLSQLSECERAEGFACVRATREHRVSAVQFTHPQLAIVLRGHKQVRHGAQQLHLAPGDLLLVTQPCRADVVNCPAADGQHSYLSTIVPLCEEVLAAARTLWREPLPAAGQAVAQLPLSGFRDELVQWMRALRLGHYAEARLALAALVVGMCRRGHGALLLPPQPSLASEVRTLLATHPERDWRSRDLEQTFAISGATLRRRLASERTQLRELLVEARLSHAMQLLYTTRLPLKTIAARAGYRSVASFSQRFQARYGLEPGAIGNATGTVA